MTEDEAWVIEELNVQSSDDTWYRYPDIHDPDEFNDMDPTTLEECLTYLRDDPFKEYSNPSIWTIRIYNLVSGEVVMYDDLCHL